MSGQNVQLLNVVALSLCIPQALTKQLAEILDFSLKFDDLKVQWSCLVMVELCCCCFIHMTDEQSFHSE